MLQLLLTYGSHLRWENPKIWNILLGLVYICESLSTEKGFCLRKHCIGTPMRALLSSHWSRNRSPMFSLEEPPVCPQSATPLAEALLCKVGLAGIMPYYRFQFYMYFIPWGAEQCKKIVMIALL